MLRLVAIALTTLTLGAPVAFTQPTSIELLPGGELLVVENNPGRVLRVDAATGRTAVLAKGLLQPYSIVRAPSGAVYFSAGTTIRKLGGGVVARNAEQIGPVAVARDGTLYYATGVGVFRVGRGRLAPNESIDSPHGLVVARDGSVLVSDTGGDRIVRIDPGGKATTFASLSSPRGLDVGPTGTVYAVDPVVRRVARFSKNGRSLGFLGPKLPGDPYDLQVARNGVVYVLEAGQVGHIRVIANGRLTTLARR